MERRRMRGKPGFAKRMLVTILSLTMLLSMFTPGMIAGAEETVEDGSVQQENTDQNLVETETGFLDSFMDAYDEQTKAGSEELSSLALSYIAKYDVLKSKILALDTASETYAETVEALNAEIATLNAAVAASGANGELTETELVKVREAAAVSVVSTAPAADTGSGEVNLTNRTVTSYVDEKTFAVTGKLPEGVTLSVQKLDDALAAFIRSDVLGLGALPAGYVGGAYDIKLMLDGAEIQPAEAVTLGVTADGITSKADVNVYHLPGTSADSVSAVSGIDLHGLVGNKIENVNCYDEGYYAFYTSGFSVYYVSAGNLNASVEEEEETVELNEVATGYITRYSALTARAKLLDPESETYAADQEALGLEAEAVDVAALTSYEAGEFDEAQWNVISQASADFYAALAGEESVEMEEATTLESVSIRQGDTGTVDNVTQTAARWRVTDSSTSTSAVDGIDISKSGNVLTITVADDVEPGTYYIRYNQSDRGGTWYTYEVNDEAYTITVLRAITSLDETINVKLASGGTYTYDFYGALGTARPTDTAYTPDVSGANGLQSNYTDGVLTVTVPEDATDGTAGTFVFDCATDDNGSAKVTINVTVDNTADITLSTITLSGLINVTQGGNSSIGSNSSSGTATFYDSNGYLVENSGLSVSSGRVYATSSAQPGTYFMKYGNSYYKVVVYKTSPGYVLDMYYYRGTNTVDYHQAIIGATKNDSSLDDNDNIKSVTLGGVDVSNTTSSASALSVYYGNLTATSPNVNKTLVITPEAGYYITEVVVACRHNNNPLNCQTWGDASAFHTTFSISAGGAATVALPSNAFGHSSVSNDYTILIEVAPLPSPLYVQFEPGIMFGKDSIFADPDAWTANATGNVLGSAGAVQTNYTQLMYKYNSDSAEAADWKLYANTITNDAKTAAAVLGYSFAGWKVEYYTNPDKTVATQNSAADSYGNLYDYSGIWDIYYGGSSSNYAEGAAIPLSTNAKVIAQWKPIKLTVTKTVEGLPSGASTTHDININKDSTTGWKNVDLTVSGSNSTTSGVFSPITAGIYSAEEINAAPSVTVGDTTYYLVSTTYSDSVTVTTDAIAAGTQSDVALTVTNTYSEATPMLKLVKVWKDATGAVMTDTSSQPDVTLTVTAVDGESTTTKEYVLKSDNNWTATDALPAGTITVAETPVAGYTGTVSGPETENAEVDGQNVIYSVYTATNQLSVTSVEVNKTVTGNMGDQQKAFSFTSTFAGTTDVAYTIYNSDNSVAGSGTVAKGTTSHTFNLKHGQKIVYTNVAIGSAFSVTEADATPYTTTVNGETGRTYSATLPVAATTVAFVNTNQVNVDTGIEVDSFPFVMMLSSVIVMAAFFLIGKRRMMF